ncbi:MAG: Zn-ribbon domain-containing OB-fold protein [Candidatus Velamenicoccus archaeovorus]
MREKIARPERIRRVQGDLPVGHRYTPGVAGEAFFTALRDRGVLLGSRCGSCGYTYVPARLFCERCFAELAADTEVGPGGELVSFTIGFVDAEDRPLELPETIGLVRLDGADALLVHRILDLGDEPLEIGVRVEAVVRPPEQRTGSILDLEGFRPVEVEGEAGG